ncbi:MAG: dephospho-CoA kinase [Chitinophagaceae bacterium]
MLKVGITGGIGSGKTTVARVFEVLGIPVYYADKETRRLMDADPEIRKQIISAFGQESYTAEGLNRKYIAQIVFNQPKLLERLNSITHPVSIQDAAEWSARQSSPYTLKEAALIFESGSASQLDFVIGVYAPEPLRIKRVMDRDGLSAPDVKARIARQIDETIKMKLCDAVIRNDDQEMVIPQVLDLHQLLLTKAGS